MEYLARAKQYARNIRTGKIPACLYVRQACQRFENDLKRKDLVLDKTQVDRWCSFLEKLPHVKGKWARSRELFKLSDYQVFCMVNIFGFYRKNGRRRFRNIYIEVPRKNGKTFWIAGIGLGMLTIENEYGAEVYCGATSEIQAWEVFKPAKLICQRLPELTEYFGIEVNAKVLNRLHDGSKFEPVIGNPGDGASPSCGIADEYHEHKNKSGDLVATFETGMGSRENPLLIQITTAGDDTSGPCYQKRDDVINILSGAANDDNVFGIIYTIDDNDAWDTIEAQKKANPNYGVSVDPDFLAGQLAQARRSALKQVAYKTKHLDVWVGSKAAWMNLLAYQRCRDKTLNINDYAGLECFVGFDLASKTDVACMCILFPPQDSLEHYVCFVRHYLPEDTINENKKYIAWHSQGFLTSTPGNVIDYNYIKEDFREIAKNHDVIEAPFDPYQATQFSTDMIAEDLPMVEVGQTVRNFSEPMKEIEAKILERKIKFEIDPVLMWMMGNVSASVDKKDNIFPNKNSPERKIDGVVALIMCFNRALAMQEQEGSIYDNGVIDIEA